MKERESFDAGFLRHVDGHVDGAVAPALARFGAGKVFVLKILGVMDQQVRAAGKLDDFRDSRLPVVRYPWRKRNSCSGNEPGTA